MASSSFNRVILMGNLTRDVELKYLQSGTAVTEVGLAMTNRRKNAATGATIEEPVFVDVMLWGRTAEVASEYLSKGSPCLIEGRLKYDTWETDGQKRSKLSVVGEKLQLLGGRNGNGQATQTTNGGSKKGATTRKRKSGKKPEEEVVAAAADGDNDVPLPCSLRRPPQIIRREL